MGNITEENYWSRWVHIEYTVELEPLRVKMGESKGGEYDRGPYKQTKFV